MDPALQAIIGTVVSFFIAIGGLGVKRVWVFGWYAEKLEKDLDKANATIEKLQATNDKFAQALDKAADTQETMADVLRPLLPAEPDEKPEPRKRGRAPERMTWEGRQGPTK